MNNLLLNAILFGIIYTDKGKELANDAVNFLLRQVKGLTGTNTNKETNDG